MYCMLHLSIYVGVHVLKNLLRTSKILIFTDIAVNYGYTNGISFKAFFLTSYCSRLRLRVDYFICFNFTRVFFYSFI